MAYTDKSGKVIIASLGVFKATVFAAVVSGDLLTRDTGNYGLKLADQSDGLAAHYVACQNGAPGDIIDCAMAVVFSTSPTESTGDFSDTALALATDVMSPLYLEESGKASESPGATLTQEVGRILSTTTSLLCPQNYLTDTALSLSGNLAVGGTAAITGAVTMASTLAVAGASTLTGAVTHASTTTMSDNVTVASGKSIIGAGTGTDGIVLKNLKNHAASALSGTKLLVEIDIEGTPYYFEVLPTKA